MTSYFWPPQRLLRSMAKASERGVKIKLILTGKADVPLAKYAERYLYKWLFRHNIEVYEYQRNILHGKSAVCDNKWLTIGSYNVNNISAFASVELNLDVKDDNLTTELNQKFEAIIANDCVQISKETFWASSGVSSKVFYYLAYRIIHMVFFMFTFYFTRRRSLD
jgi:cardiolipin synthase